MSILSKLTRAMRGEVSLRKAMLEGARRSYVAARQKGERQRLQRQASQTARLSPKFSNQSGWALLDHFRQRTEPHFFPTFDLPLHVISASQREQFPDDTSALIVAADRIMNEQAWPLLGLCDYRFVDWHRDPLSDHVWPLELASDIALHRNDGSDVRVVWELNRLGHLITLARAYSVTEDERLPSEFFRQVNSWDSQNPLGFGVNWNCAMEVALRALNLLGAFTLFRRSPGFNADSLAQLLRIFDQHGRFIREHLEFSYLATSNHYLANVVGLLWLGITLPELADAGEWRTFGLRELKREMSKQVLPDGADYESSTGYHRLVLQLFLYSFMLCRFNGIEIEEHYWQKLQKMFKYLGTYLRPDGSAPLLGDSDGGQVFPICHRSGDDHGFLLPLGAVLFDDSQLKNDRVPNPPELLWLLGNEGVAKYQRLTPDSPKSSQQFPDVGIFIVREADNYLLLNASGTGLDGRGSHGHNDALSIEVAVFERAFIVDPGSYVYTADLHERHLFRSTAYHSTVQIDGVEQNETNEQTPFVIGNQAQPQLINWFTGEENELISAEHYGYERLPSPVIHRRTVKFMKHDRLWFLEDEFFGGREHKFATRFHFDSGLDVFVYELFACGTDPVTGNRLFICPLDLRQAPELESKFTSRDYAKKMNSISACWTIESAVPARLRWVIIPVCSDEDPHARLRAVTELQDPLSKD